MRDANRGRPRSSSLIPNADCYARELGSAVNGSFDMQADSNQRGHKHSMTVDVVLSDMSAPWFQTTGFGKRSLSDPYNRMMNTSGIGFKDHAGSMVSCQAHRVVLEFTLG